MRRTNHVARLAAEQVARGVSWEEIEREELSALEALCRAELQDRDYRERKKNQPDFWETSEDYFNKPF